MNDVQTIPSNPATIQLNHVADPKPIATRRQEAEERKNEFYKQLEESRNVEPVTKVSVTTEAVRREDRHTENERPVESTHDEDESVAEDNFDTTDNELDSKLIPKKRFDKELEKRKVLEEEVRRERDERIKYQTELSLYNKALDSLHDKQNSPQQPDLDPIDSDAHSYYMEKIRNLESKFETQRTNLSEYEIRQNFANTVNHQAAEISKTHPDFDDAYNYVLGVEANKARMVGFDENQAQEYAMNQLQPIAWQAFNSGKNVAETMYNVAKNYGYQSKNSPINAPIKESRNAPDFDKLDKNMQKSHSILNEIKGASSAISSETAAYTTVEGFTRKLAGKGGRGTNTNEFHKALEKIRNSY